MSKITYHRTLFEKALHWGLAFSVLAVWFYFENGDAPHRYAGYFAFLVALIQQFRSLLNENKVSDRLISDHPFVALFVHNMIWLLTGALALSGWMMGLDRFWGEDWLERLHNIFSWALMVFVVIHLTGVFLDALKYRRPTWLLMITSIKSK